MDRGLGPVIQFGDFRLDGERRTLTSLASGRPVALGSRAFAVLLHLASRPGVLMSKTELMEAVWPDVTVEENNLSQCISALRRALGETPGESRFILTEPGRGFRFTHAAPAASQTGRATRDPQAYQAYVSGWYALTRPGAGNLERGLAHLERAVERDPGFALAHVCIADGFALLGVFGVTRPREIARRAWDAVERALALEPGLAEAHAEKGHLQAVLDLDFAAAEASYRHALSLDPRSILANHYMGLLMIGLGRTGEALTCLRRAQAEEPLAANISANIGLALYFAGRHGEAIAQLEATLELDADFAHARALLGRTHVRLGAYDKALAEFSRRTSDTVMSRADIPMTLALAGRKAEAQEMLDALLLLARTRYVSPYEIATIEMALGARQAALDHLEEAAAEAAMQIGFLNVDPLFEPLRGEPRLQALLARLRLA